MKFLKTGWLLLFLVISTTSSIAAEWSLNAAIKQDIGYDDNVRMSSKDPQSSFLYHLTPVVNFSHRTPVSDLSANASYGYQHFFDISELNRDFQNYGIVGQYRMERISWALASTLSIAPARDSAEEDSGVFGVDAEKTNRTINPSVTYQLTQLDSLNFAPSYSDASYSTDDFSDSVNMGLNLGWTRNWTERYSSSLSIFYSNFKSSRNSSINGLETTSDSIGINLSSSYLLSEKWDIYGTIGGRVTESDTDFITILGKNSIKNKTKAGFLLDAGFNYNGESLSAQFNVNRSLVPSSQGQLNEQSRISLNLDYQITERLSVGMLSSYQESESASLDGQTESSSLDEQLNNRKNLTIQPSLSWKLNPDWALSTSYRYRYQDRSGNEKAADSNSVMLSINYQWPGLSIAR